MPWGVSVRIQFYELTPRPCLHDLRGKPHERRSEILSCINRNGIPGFDLTEIHLTDVGRSK
jgi:hypothetical protein